MPMSKLAPKASANRPMLVAFDGALTVLLNEHLRVQVDAMDKSVKQYQGGGRKTQEVFEWGTNMADVLALFQESLVAAGHWQRLQTELGLHGEDQTIVLHAECSKGEYFGDTSLEKYLGATAAMAATSKVACKKYAALLGDNNGFMCITARNADLLLAGHHIVLVSSPCAWVCLGVSGVAYMYS